MMISEMRGATLDTKAREDGRPSALSPATHRAYASDLRDIEAWCRSRNISGGLSDLDERRVFAYVVDLIHKGRSPATVRRRLTALRGFVAARAEGSAEAAELTAQQLFNLEKRVLVGRDRQTSVLVISDDPITRAGLRVVLSDSGVLCWSDTVHEADLATMTVWDYVLVWIATSRGIDPFSAIKRLCELGLEITTATPIVAISPTTLPLMVRLRLAEAGVRYALPHNWLSSNLSDLSARLSSADIPQHFHLETPLALRQKLGLNLDGNLAMLLDAAVLLPSEIWTGHRPQQHLPISRGQVHKLRRLALEEAGIPAPDFSKYASSLRRPPSAPEWGKVREIVRAAFDL